MSFKRWLKEISRADSIPGLESMLTESKFFKKLVLSVYSIPEKILAKIEEDNNLANPQKKIQILLPEHPQSREKQEKEKSL